MLNKFIVLLILILQLNADTLLKSTYYIDSDEIHISTIINDVKKDELLYKLNSNRYTKRVKSKELIKILKQHGYKDVSSKNRYIKFEKKSPIDTSEIATYIKNYYLNQYDNIDIKEIRVRPRAYISTLAEKYSIEIKKRNFLSKSGIVSIKTPQNKKIFFNYDIDATLKIYKTRKKIKKDVELSALNTIKKSIILDKFMAKPVQNLKAHTLQSKHHIKKDKIITTRDVAQLSIVKKNSYINVSLNNNNMSISFSAKALESGTFGDIINVKKTNGKRLKVRVTGRNKAEIR